MSFNKALLGLAAVTVLSSLASASQGTLSCTQLPVDESTLRDNGVAEIAQVSDLKIVCSNSVHQTLRVDVLLANQSISPLRRGATAVDVTLVVHTKAPPASDLAVGCSCEMLRQVTPFLIEMGMPITSIDYATQTSSPPTIDLVVYVVRQAFFQTEVSEAILITDEPSQTVSEKTEPGALAQSGHGESSTYDGEEWAEQNPAMQLVKPTTQWVAKSEARRNIRRK